MKLVRVMKVILLLTVCIALIGCTGTPTPPVKTAKNVAKLVEEGMMLDEVSALMSVGLRETPVLFPALGIEQQADETWQFESQEGGLSEDTEASYHALVFIPSRSGDNHYMIFFEEGSLVGDTWFSHVNAYVIEQLLGGTWAEE